MAFPLTRCIWMAFQVAEARGADSPPLCLPAIPPLSILGKEAITRVSLTVWWTKSGFIVEFCRWLKFKVTEIISLFPAPLFLRSLTGNLTKARDFRPVIPRDTPAHGLIRSRSMAARQAPETSQARGRICSLVTMLLAIGLTHEP